MATQQRNSSIELLRIISILGILCMHVGGVFGKSTHFVTIISLNLINSLFNICVTCFVLIAGYYGIKRKKDKLFSLWCIVVFYSIASVTVLLIMGEPIEIVTLFKFLFPTITAKYWYFTTYVILAVFAPYINKIPEVLSKKQFEGLLLLLILFFYAAPTFFYFEIIKDNGKGPVNMFVVYLIGRYIAVYKAKSISRLKLGFMFCGVIIAAFCLNVGASLLRKQSWAPFARDNSLFMLVGAVLFFLIFLNMSFVSKYVNFMAKNVFAVYIGEGIFRNLILAVSPVSAIDGKIYIIPFIVGLAMILFLVCSIVELARGAIFCRMEKYLFKLVQKLFCRLRSKIRL